jgi:hypothetical protein
MPAPLTIVWLARRDAAATRGLPVLASAGCDLSRRKCSHFRRVPGESPGPRLPLGEKIAACWGAVGIAGPRTRLLTRGREAPVAASVVEAARGISRDPRRTALARRLKRIAHPAAAGLKRSSAYPSYGGALCHFGGNGRKSLRGSCRCIHAGSGSCAGSRPSLGCSGSTAAHSRSSRAPGDASSATPRSAAPTQECSVGSATRPRRRTRTYARAELSGHRRAGPLSRSVCSSPTCAATRN